MSTESTFAVLLSAVLTVPAHAQTFRGRVVEDATDEPVATALVSLLDEDGDEVGVSIADSAGFYQVRAPAPGVYRLRAERIGFVTFESPLLDVETADGTYPIDLALRVDPLHLPGFTVTSDRVSDEQADREIQLMLGISPASLRYRPIGLERLQDHVDRAHSLVDVVRWQNKAGMVVRQTRDGPCFSVRSRGCLPVYLNGLPLRREFVETVPLDMLYRVVIVTPTDGTMAYPAGAVLLYTEAWLR